MTSEPINDAVTAIRAHSDIMPRLGFVLGSGLGAFADEVRNATSIDYSAIAGFPVPSVAGHGARLVLGTIGPAPVAVLQGRVHLYEGHQPELVARPVRVLAALGVKALILTNAAGAVNAAYEPGDLMVIRDHLNFQWMNPLVGRNDDELGPRFPDMSNVYNPEFSARLAACGREAGLTVHEGVYAAMLGPSYETPAEIRFLRLAGADAVGMSTVAEAIAARHAGLTVGAVSVITNKAAGLSATPLSHAEVQKAGAAARPRLCAMFTQFATSVKL
jgi:purine-nucleoside phosphorylase